HDDTRTLQNEHTLIPVNQGVVMLLSKTSRAPDEYSWRLMMPRPRRIRLFPYTTLFRSGLAGTAAGPAAVGGLRHQLANADCAARSEEHTSELQSRENLVCRLLLEKKKKMIAIRLTAA